MRHTVQFAAQASAGAAVSVHPLHIGMGAPPLAPGVPARSGARREIAAASRPWHLPCGGVSAYTGDETPSGHRRIPAVRWRGHGGPAAPVVTTVSGICLELPSANEGASGILVSRAINGLIDALG